MNITINIIKGLFLGFLIAYIVMFIRVEKISRYRLNMIDTDMERYKKLPSFAKMLFKFWIPIDKF